MDDMGAAWAALKTFIPAVLAALLGRIVFYIRDAQANRRRVLTWDILFEIPIALMMGFTAQATLTGVDKWWPQYSLAPEGQLAVCIVAAYLGPRMFDNAMTFVLKRFGVVKEVP